MEQKRPADIFQEFLDYLWNGLGLEEKGWKRLKKGDFKKKMKNGLTYQVWFDRSRYNYIDYEIGYGNVEVGFSCIIKQGDDRLYSFKIEPTTGGSFLYPENHWLGQWFQRAYGDKDDKKTPFAILKVRSANCTKNSKGRTFRWD